MSNRPCVVLEGEEARASPYIVFHANYVILVVILMIVIILVMIKSRFSLSMAYSLTTVN